MERLRINYRPLLNVQLLHHRYLDDGATPYEELTDARKQERLRQYNVNELVDIQPTPTCVETLKKYGLLFRPMPTGFLAGIRTAEVVTDENGVVPEAKPYRVLDASLVLDFSFRFKEGIGALTALPTAVKQEGELTAYFFSNELARTSNVVPSTLCLPLLTYSHTRKYLKGDLMQNEGKRYICITPERAGVLNIPPSNLTHWQVMNGTTAFASMAHRVKASDKGIRAGVNGLIRLHGGETFGAYDLTETGFLRSPDFTIDFKGF